MTGASFLPRRIAEIARSLQAETGTEDTRDLAVSLAAEILPAAEDAAILIAHRNGVIETPAPAGNLASQVHRIREELGQGPDLSAIWDEEVVSCPNVETETRWGDWGPRVAQETPVRSMICFRMFTHRERVGSLNFYATEPNAFNGEDIDTGLSFAAHAAIAFEVAEMDENKDIALDSRSLIGQATGIVMALYDIDAVRAFAVLKRISNSENVKLHHVAVELVRTRHLPKPG